MTHILNHYKKHYPFITEGFVLDVDDPDQMGRIKVWCPALDGETFTVSSLPWAEYASPFGGITINYPAGREEKVSKGPVGYGFWAIPKLSTQVLVFLLNGNPGRRFYFAAYHDLHRNRSIPSGRNVKPGQNSKKPEVGPFTDSYDPLEPAYTNLREQFAGDVSSTVAATRGVIERQIAQDRDNKTGQEGYAQSPADSSYKDPQTYCWVTPGHNVITMTDNPDNCRIRIKTCEGHQIIMDDTNERIYISTAKGKNWIEMDEDGHIHIYGKKSISVHSEEDINLIAGKNINLQAGNGINTKSVGPTKITGGDVHIKSEAMTAITGCTLDLNGDKTRMTGTTIDIKASKLFALEGWPITAKTYPPPDYDQDEFIIKGNSAAEASCAIEADPPTVIPQHEPWGRPVGSGRNKRYKG